MHALWRIHCTPRCMSMWTPSPYGHKTHPTLANPSLVSPHSLPILGAPSSSNGDRLRSAVHIVTRSTPQQWLVSTSGRWRNRLEWSLWCSSEKQNRPSVGRQKVKCLERSCHKEQKRKSKFAMEKIFINWTKIVCNSHVIINSTNCFINWSVNE